MSSCVQCNDYFDGSDSPVSMLLSTRSPDTEIKRMSAGILLPVSRQTRSPSATSEAYSEVPIR